MNDEYQECENCAHKGQCNMECYNEYSVWWVSDSGDSDE